MKEKKVKVNLIAADGSKDGVVTVRLPKERRRPFGKRT